MVSVPEQDWHIAGTIWGVSEQHLHIECPAEVSPGMTLSLSLIVPGTDHVICIEKALVTWTCGQEFGLRHLNLKASEAARLEAFVRNKIV